jgi:hypothetical protein
MTDFDAHLERVRQTVATLSDDALIRDLSTRYGFLLAVLSCTGDLGSLIECDGVVSAAEILSRMLEPADAS